ncbi:MAG TPA: TIGR03621 family F420-dependent LLM class oxidoreductase [Candidatus Angelobacter sp.]|nr:TIGR03621 family F420-dependent LLM class oxidoreductase [Candidatus Angelobacter sp.]
MPPETRPFRFGLSVPTRDVTRRGVLELARRAESAGIQVLLGSDHLGGWGALPLLQAAAQATSLRIGSLVLNNDLRHPAVLAQELATIDLVTDGRLEIGIGAGWNRPEYEAAGLAFDAPPQRIARMRAAVAMLRSALRDGVIEHDADDAYPTIRQTGLPTSVQRPHPPILVGGGGPRLLAYAAREANIVGLDPRSLPDGGHDPLDVTAGAIDRKVGWIRDAAGDRWGELEINVAIYDVDPEYERRGMPRPDPARRFPDAEVAASPHYLVGDADRMVEDLQERRERWGISYLVIGEQHLDVMRPVVERLSGR